MFRHFIISLIIITDAATQPLTNRDDSLFGMCSGVDHKLLQILRIENTDLRKQLAVYNKKSQSFEQQMEYMQQILHDLSYKYETLNALFMETGAPKLPETSPDQPRDPGTTVGEQNAEQSPPIAFYAAVSVDTETNPVVFDKVYLNEGGCYNNTTGEFTCSVGGVYHITWAVETFGEEDVGTILDVNGEEFGYTWTDSQDQQYDTSTSVAILRLNAGDVIKVTLQSGSKVDARQSVFTGHFLFR